MELQPYNDKFQKVVNIIETARENAHKKVNEELILMYRDIGKFSLHIFSHKQLNKEQAAA